MRGYNGIEVSTSACVRFVRNSEVDGSEQQLFEEVRRRGIRCAYVDAAPMGGSDELLANQVARALNLENAPYETSHWLCLLDDLITLAHRERGLIVVVDNASKLIDERRTELFDLIEAFLTQFHHWFEQRKPCYLCFQVEAGANVAFLLRHVPPA